MKLRGFIRLLGSSAVQFLSLAVLGLILAKCLTVEEFGITRTVTAYMVVLTILGHMTMHDAVATYVASSNTIEAKSQYVTHGMAMVLSASVLLAAAFCLTVSASDMWSGIAKKSLITVVMILPLECLTLLTMSLLNASGDIRSMAAFSVVCGTVPLGIIAPCTATWGMDGWIVARVVSSCTIFGVGVFIVRDYLRVSSIDIRKASDLVRFARVQFVSGALSTAMLSGDVIVLERLTHDSRVVGHYGLATLFSRPLALIPSTLGRLYFKEIASSGSIPGQQWEMIHRLLKFTLGIGGVFAGLVFICGGSFVRLLYGEEYADSVRVLEILSLGIIFSSLWSVLSTTNIALKRPAYSVATSITGLVVAAVMFILFVPSDGAVGAAWSMNAAYIFGCLVGGTLLWREWSDSSRSTKRRGME